MNFDVQSYNHYYDNQNAEHFHLPKKFSCARL